MKFVKFRAGGLAALAKLLHARGEEHGAEGCGERGGRQQGKQDRDADGPGEDSPGDGA